MPQTKGLQSPSKRKVRQPNKEEPRCYQDLIGGENEKTPTQQAPTRLRRTPAYPDLPRDNASYELAKFLRTTGPVTPGLQMSTEAPIKRSESLPRQIMQRFVRKSKSDIKQENKNDSKSSRFTYDALKGHWVALGAEHSAPPLPAGLPEGVVQKTTAEGKKYLALRLPLEIKGDGCIDYSCETHDIPLDDVQAEDLTGMTSDQVIDGWLQDLRAKSIKNGRLSTASSMAVGQLGAFVPSEKSQPSVHPALRGHEDIAVPVSSDSASDSYSLCSEDELSDERNMASASSEDLLATPKAGVTSITVTECPPDVPMRSPARKGHDVESESFVQSAQQSGKTTPPHVSISKLLTARSSYARSNSAGDLLYTPSNKMLTGRDGRCKSMTSPLDAAAMESIINSINWTLHKKTAGLPISKFADASKIDPVADQRRDSVSPLSSTFDTTEKTANVENIQAVITPRSSVSESSHSRGNSSTSCVSQLSTLNMIPEQPSPGCPSPRSVSPLSMRKPDAISKPKYRKDPHLGIHNHIAGGQGVSPIQWNLNGASWLAEPSDSERSHSITSLTEPARPLEQPIRRLHSAASNGHTVRKPAARRTRVNAGSTGSPRHTHHKSDDSRSLQGFMPAGHFPSAPSPAPDKALPPLPAHSSPSRSGTPTQRTHVSVPRRKPVPQAGNAFRGNGAESPQKRKRLWLTPSNQDLHESYAVNTTPPLSTPLTNMVDLEVLEDHLTELQYRASQLSAMVVDMYNNGGLGRAPSASQTRRGHGSRLLL